MPTTPNFGLPIVDSSPEKAHDLIPQIRDFQLAVDAAMRTRMVLASSIQGVVLDGVYSTATTAGSGTDNTTALQAILDTASSSSSLVLVIDGRALVSGLRVKSNTTITGMSEGDGLILKSNSLRAVVANYNRTPDPGARVEANITLKTLTIDGNFFGNNDGTGTGGRFEADGLTWKTGVQFAGVDNLQLENITVRQSRTFGIHIGNINGARFSNVQVTHTNPTAIHNNDGIHVNGNTTNLTLSKTRISGTTDDGIAINADDGYDQLGPLFEAGPIKHVRIYDTVFDTCFFGFRIISNTQPLDDVEIYNSWARVSDYFARFDNLDSYFGNSNIGNIGTVKFFGVHAEGFYAGPISSSGQQGSAEYFRVECGIDHLAIFGLERNGLTWHPDWRAILKTFNGQTETWTSNSSYVKLLEIEYSEIHPAGTDYSAAASPAANQPIVIMGPVDKLIVKAHASIDSSLTPFRGILQIWTGDVAVGVKEAIISGKAELLINSVVLTSGKLDRLRLQNFTDIDNGGVTFLVNNIASAGNVKFWHTDLETDGGTVLSDLGSKVTDMTSSGGSGAVEGTFTPALSFAGSSTGITYSYRWGKYLKLGNRVWVEARMALSSKGSATGAAKVSGLPHAASATTNDYQLSYADVEGASYTGVSFGYIDPAATTTLNLAINNGGTGALIDDTHLTNTSIIHFSMWYSLD